MVKAPTPGSTPTALAEKGVDTQRLGLVIKQGGNEYPLNMNDLGPNDDLVARKQTGLPVTPFFEEDKFGADSLLIMYWMARRKNGEPNLRYQSVVDEFPTYQAVAEAEFEIVAVEDEKEVEGDPLPSDAT